MRSPWRELNLSEETSPQPLSAALRERNHALRYLHLNCSARIWNERWNNSNRNRTRKKLTNSGNRLRPQFLVCNLRTNAHSKLEKPSRLEKKEARGQGAHPGNQCRRYSASARMDCQQSQRPRRRMV